jgi:uncharacterized phage protein (TIGR02218 family)
VRIWSGLLSEVTRQGAAFSAELVSLKADLERQIGQVYARTCDAEVGDSRCGVDLGDPALRAEGVVANLTGPMRFVAGVLEGFADGWFSGGMLTWVSGANAGQAARVLRHGGSELALARTPRFSMSEGDAFVVTAGCDKSFAMCGERFGNRVRFRGFPHLPGPEAVLAGRASDRENNGGRRA